MNFTQSATITLIAKDNRNFCGIHLIMIGYLICFTELFCIEMRYINSVWYLIKKR